MEPSLEVAFGDWLTAYTVSGQEEFKGQSLVFRRDTWQEGLHLGVEIYFNLLLGSGSLIFLSGMPFYTAIFFFFCHMYVLLLH